jgi:hypothetical protein
MLFLSAYEIEMIKNRNKRMRIVEYEKGGMRITKSRKAGGWEVALRTKFVQRSTRKKRKWPNGGANKIKRQAVQRRSSEMLTQKGKKRL